MLCKEMQSRHIRGKKVIKRPRRFCKYKQEVGGKTVYFKEFGDPRIMDNRNGHYVTDEEMSEDDGIPPVAYQANEIIDFTIGTELYGEVRWMGQILGVDGARKAENLNNSYFSKGRHTPLMIMVKGGTLTDDSFSKLQQYMDEIQGERGQHAFLVLEVENNGSTVSYNDEEQKAPDIEVKDLASILQKDELFQEYIENGRKRVQSSFRLPDLYTGYTTDFNRATAQTAMEVTEEQVFQPERKSLAWAINNRLLNGYGFKYVEAYFLAPDISNPDDLFKILSVTERAGGLTPNKAKTIIGNAMGEKVENFEGEWGEIPIAAKDLIASLNPHDPAMPMDDILSQLTGQITKAASHNDDAVVAVMKEVRNLLLNFEANSGIVKYNPDQPRDENGRFAGGGSSMGRSPKIGKKEAARVSSGILTDHPEYQTGENHGYFFGEHYFRFNVNGPGDYQFTMRIKIVGNEDRINALEEWNNE